MQRMNVMLTRCREGMIIVSNKRFLQNVGYKTLLGRLAKYWDTEMRNAGFRFQWATDKEVLNEAVDLPGVKGRSAPMTALAAARMVLSTKDTGLRKRGSK
jgi:hypothetical protein